MVTLSKTEIFSQEKNTLGGKECTSSIIFNVNFHLFIVMGLFVKDAPGKVLARNINLFTKGN